MGQWSKLAVDLLDLIDGYLGYIDKIRVRAICVSWSSFFPNMPKGPKLEGKHIRGCCHLKITTVHLMGYST